MARKGKSTRTHSTGKTARKTTSQRQRRTVQEVARKPSFWQQISPERKLDILGVILALLGLLTLLSMVSRSQGSLTSAWVMVLKQAAGWGAFVLPLSLLGFGVWLLFRHVEHLPQLSVERLLGIFLLLLNFFGWLSIFKFGDDIWIAAKSGLGGGYIGGAVEWLLIAMVGKAGSIVILITWLILALILTFDISFTDLVRSIKRGNKPSPAMNPEPRSVAHQKKMNIETETSERVELPPTFQPLRPLKTTPGQEATAKSKNIRPAMKKEPVEKSTASSAEPTLDIQPEVKLPASTIWNLPPIDKILDAVSPHSQAANLDNDRARLIEETLRSFSAPAHVVEIHRGPTVTQFGVEPEFVENRTGKTRVRVARIAALADDLALALAAPRIRIQAPVPGRNYVGIEVPNTNFTSVSLREVIESDPFRKQRPPLRFALGKDVAGKPIAGDLTSLPHLLIAGTTGSGKSVCVNSLLCCFLIHNSPESLRMILVDPKRVELTGYNGIPHLLAPVVVEPERVIGALQWVLREMDSRYHRFSQNGSRNIQEYNNRHPDERLPYLLVVIDELADLMMLAPDETERSVARLAQLARATGIHLIIATQRPSVDVVTGIIKANFPSRIAFSVASNVDSRVILDQPGAEKLLGKGDMLYQAPDAPAPVRVQGTYVSDGEIQRLVEFWREETERVKATQPNISTPEMGDALPKGLPLTQKPLFEEMKPEVDGDPLLPEAIDLVRKEGRASITMLQRRMRVGYTRAARLIDTMEEQGIIGSSQTNSQVREVLDFGPTIPPADDGM
jgi:S-DNA-T family DNA segregation ATPase FtsK/SpoIIIE